MDRSGRRRRPRREENSAPWMLTYSDMVTLLLTFFILLFAMSVIDIERFKDTIISIQSSLFGHTGIMESPREAGSPDGVGDAEIDARALDLGQSLLEKAREAEALRAKAELFLARAGLEGAVEIRIEERGVVMELPNQIFFERGSAELKPRAREFLKGLALFIREIKQRIIIEGHTCNLPINTARYPSNWELSAARSVGVTRYLVETQGLAPDRFMATGYGEYQPVADNGTAEGRAKNRRVTIVFSLSK
ncbi:MAG: OmpA family protein [Firmicutes bacterium]|nr:OmpA family protein [Bacillota bacterium]